MLYSALGKNRVKKHLCSGMKNKYKINAGRGKRFSNAVSSILPGTAVNNSILLSAMDMDHD